MICAPSGSGKTLIGELCAIANIFQKFGKSVYLVPFKALATEKYFHFKRFYERFGVKVELSIGDHDVDDSKLEKADIIITTYEKMDSLLRNFYDKDWIYGISTVIIDEIHIIGESSRGPRLESLIVRLNEFLKGPQIIGLSATIANPEFFNSWLNSLGIISTLIKSDKRPVPLHYKIEITQNKDSTIKRIVKSTLEKKGQVLIFLNKRKKTHKMATNLKLLVKKHLEDSEIQLCKNIKKTLSKVSGVNHTLLGVCEHGIAFHHAGLLPKERKLIEDSFRKKVVKVICCTTTLSAGINTPARVVILKDFKKFVTSGYNIKNFSGFYENGDGFSYFKPFSANEAFQILGRAGRPGLDAVGYGYILVNDIDERMWLEDHYFTEYHEGKKAVPKYNNLKSGLNKINTLREQVLLRVYEEKKITLPQLKQFFERTYFWYDIKDRMKEKNIPIEQFLLIQEISPENILKLHSEPKKVKLLKEKNYKIKLTKVTDSTLQGYIKTDVGVYECRVDIDTGIKCECGFQNGISDNFGNTTFAFEFCDHITSFILYLINLRRINENLRKYIDDIIPRSIKHQYILSYLFSKGLIWKDENGKIRCTQFGKLIIRLYLYPTSGVLIRNKLENAEINSYQDLLKASYEILISEGRVRDHKMLDPLIEWTEEIPIDQICEAHKIMAGDLHSTRENLERIITFTGVIARHLGDADLALIDKLMKVAEMAETLRIRLHHGIREELFDLVLRLDNVGRVRARILHKAGYHASTKVKKESPYALHRKTGLGINLCKKIIGVSKKSRPKIKDFIKGSQ